MTAVDEISQILGRLEEGHRQLQRQIEEGNRFVANELGYARTVRNEMANQLQQIPGFVSRLAAVEEGQAVTGKTVEKHEAIIQRAIGMGVVVGAIGAGVLWLIEHAFTWAMK